MAGNNALSSDTNSTGTNANPTTYSGANGDTSSARPIVSDPALKRRCFKCGAFSKSWNLGSKVWRRLTPAL